MDTNVRRRRAHKTIIDTSSDIYKHDLSLFNEPPRCEIQLTEFEELAIDRVQLFRTVEQAALKGHKMWSDDWMKCIKEDLVKHNLKKFVRLMSGLNGQTETDQQARRADHLSHYILRLAYCRSEDLRRWFLAREMEWFRIKFMAQSTASILQFIQINGLNFVPISNEEKNALQEKLMMCTAGLLDAQIASSDFYMVPFTDVLSLVRNRKVYLEEGNAYIPMTDLVVCIQSKFRSSLSESLNQICHKLPQLDDERLAGLLKNLNHAYTGHNYNASGNRDAINLADLDEYSRKHFPLCMRHLHETLRATHHLKHFARLIYGLFLKNIGLQYEDFIEFWRQEFTKKMDEDKFNKGYLYNFNHQFGKVGRRLSYSPYSCVKIITGNIGPGENHCCPFRHFDASLLKSKLVDYGVSSEGVNDILNLVSNGHYQIACTKYYEYIHSHPPNDTINHPNQYFDESLGLVKEKAVK